MTFWQNTGLYYGEFLSQICRQRGVKKYLEIGVQQGLNLANMEVHTAVGVDPDFCLVVDPTIKKSVLSLYRMTSDAYFSLNADTNFDMTFLDGMHLFEYLLRDFYNAEARSKANGLILIHDCLPGDVEMSARTSNGGAWTGDVWKIIPALKKYRPDLKIVLVDCAPTGLLCVTNLNPRSTVLQDNYFSIIEELQSHKSDFDILEELYNQSTVASASGILSDFNHSLYFRI